MKYFQDIDKSVEVLEYAKTCYKSLHDKFHISNMNLINIDRKNDNFYSFLKKISLMDLQSRPLLLSKHDMYKIYDELERYFSEIDFIKSFNSDPEKILNYLYSSFIEIHNIGHKIAYLIVKNICCFGNTKKYFNIERKNILPYLKVPIDIHIRTLLCYRFQISPTNAFDKISAKNNEFQKELVDVSKSSQDFIPIDLDILWYIGYHNCNKRIYCSKCYLSKYCKDKSFTTETKKKISDTKRKDREIRFVKKHKEIVF